MSDERLSRKPSEAPSRIPNINVERGPIEDDKEVATREPVSHVGDRRQRACLDCLVRSLYALSSEAQLGGGPRKGQKVKAVAAYWKFIYEGAVVDEASVIRRHGREGGRPAVITGDLTYESVLG